MALCFLYPPTHRVSLYLLTSIFSPQIASLTLPGFGPSWESTGAALFQLGPTEWPFSHFPLRETPWNYLAKLCMCVCVGGDTVADTMDYIPLCNPQFPMPLTSFVKQAKKLNSSISQLSHLTSVKENMPFWINSKASLGENHLPLFFPIIPAWNVGVKVRCAAATLQMWGHKPEGKDLHGRQKGRKLESTSVPDGILEPLSQLWIVSSRLIYVMNYTHTYNF